MASRTIVAFAAAIAIALPALAAHERPVGSAQDDGVFAYVEAKAGARKAAAYVPLIRQKAAKYRLPALLVAHIVDQESHFDPHCRTGPSRGLMQVNRGHARQGDDLLDPATNLEYGCRILREYHDWAAARLPRSADSRRVWEYALTAYNWGPTRAASRGLYRSRYSDKVMRRWRPAEPRHRR